MRFSVNALAALLLSLGSASNGFAADTLPPGLSATWVVEDLNGKGVIDDLQTTLEIRTDGSYGGNGGCNTYRGNLKFGNEGEVTFAPAAATRKMCAPAVMDQEQKFFDALGTVKSWKLENGLLHLADKDGGHAMRLAMLRNTTDIVLQVPNTITVDRQTVAYDCDGDLKVRADYINAESVSLAILSFGDNFVIASNVLSGSGARYAGGQFEWWTKGDEGTLKDLTKGAEAPGIACHRAP
ncbi:heat shock protein HslJ [Mycoplana sp. BE70]|uniref:META domain-containing protein n=1 Tax=Mycoplana sp. BE70 TaxID=2817775 RepID=UPI0028678846|nr:META domain-containing protein [Mycoplana sp. BE70]MDR6755480.1 heat shock protein HslJ [Mycoplana sp. BE70]